MDTIKTIIGVSLPNVKDMKLISKFGKLNWTYAFTVKVVLIAIAIWFIFDYLGIFIFIGRK
jgi:hypothetical protein